MISLVVINGRARSDEIEIRQTISYAIQFATKKVGQNCEPKVAFYV